ncbi:hypothetical protein WCQ02_42455, partial [Paraburkholderia tropica]
MLDFMLLLVDISSTLVPTKKFSGNYDTFDQDPWPNGLPEPLTSNWLARKAVAQGHQVRIVPAQFVKPFVKSNKTDIVDAEAIAE